MMLISVIASEAKQIQAGGTVLRAEPAKVPPAKPVELPAEGWIASSLRSSQ